MTALFLSFFLLLYKTGKGFVGQTAVASAAKDDLILPDFTQY